MRKVVNFLPMHHSSRKFTGTWSHRDPEIFGISVREAASIMGCSVANIHHHINRGNVALIPVAGCGKLVVDEVSLRTFR